MELRARAARKQEAARNKVADAEAAELQSTLAGETTRARLAKAALEDEKRAYEEKGQALTGEHAQLQQQMQAARRAAEEAQAQLEAQRVKVAAFVANPNPDPDPSPSPSPSPSPNSNPNPDPDPDPDPDPNPNPNQGDRLHGQGRG